MTTTPDDTPAAPRTAESAERLLEERDAALRALRAAVRDTTRLTRLFTVLSEPTPLEKTLDRVLATLSELFAADIVALLAPRDGGFGPVSAVGWPLGSMEHVAAAPPCSPIATAIDRGTAVAIADLAASHPVDPLLLELGASTAVWLPVRGDQAPRGVLLLARCRPAPFARADVDLLQAMAYRVGQSLDRVHDESERRQLEARLRQAEKSESLGRMAGAVAHHFNNMLGVIAGSLDLAGLELPPGHAGRHEIDRARSACARAAETSSLMLTYLGQRTVPREPVDLVATVRQTLESLRGSLPITIRLAADLPADGLVVLGSRTQIAQILSNLVANARDAIDDARGDIRVSTRPVPAGEIPSTRVGTEDWRPQADTYVCLDVSDSGCGMDARTLGQIFDPFFTTKSIGRGLGLSAALGIVRSHDGVMSVSSETGTGTTFRVYWPLHARVGRSAPATVPAWSLSPEGANLVLLADDEDLVREMVGHMLQRLGYDVLTAAGGEEAIDLFRQHGERVRAVVLDVTMPAPDGWATLAAMRHIRPDIPAVFASGYDEAQILGEEHAERPQVFLHKPFVLADLRAAIETASEGSPQDAEAPPCP
jgi:signal transduction histidine kinase/ActR/RegA family two-component response regulator